MQARLTGFRELTAREITGFDCIEFLASYFRDPSDPAENSGISKSTGWAIIEELSIRRRVRTFLVSWGQTTLVKKLLCRFIVKLWVLVSNNIHRYERNFLPQSTNFRETFRLPACVTDLLRRKPSLASYRSCQHVGAWVDSASMSVHDSFVIDGQN